MQFLALLLSLVTYFQWSAAGTIRGVSSSPTVTVKNGTYEGVHNDHYNQDYFLGIPFAQPPVGDLRLAPPAYLNSSFSGIRSAKDFSPGCIQFQAAGINRPLSEDCLSINVIRPSGFDNQKLPVLVWIFGGGYTQGLNRDPRYNLTFMVDNGVKIGKPFIATSINYRLNGFGFLDSTEIRAAGLNNLGLYDQRLALHWVQENIAAFGGDPTKVTIWGQSAGAGSVGLQLLAYGGRDDSLFRGAIADSGGPLAFQGPSLNASDTTYQKILSAVGCNTSTDTIACLRGVPSDIYASAVNASSGRFFPIVDGDFFQKLSSVQLANGEFVKVPLMTGANSDEGTNFVGKPSTPYSNSSTFLSYAAGNVANKSVASSVAETLGVLYPDIPAIGTPHNFHGRPNATYGSQYGRVAALSGDLTIHRGRRLTSQSWTKFGVPVYSYYFNAWPVGGLDQMQGTTHFAEVALIMDDELGNGYVAPWYPAGSPFAGQGESFYTLARLMSRMWISFIVDQTPNHHGLWSYDGHAVPVWPVYAQNSTDALEGYGMNLVFDQSLPGLAQVAPDTYRAQSINYLIQNSATLFGT